MIFQLPFSPIGYFESITTSEGRVAPTHAAMVNSALPPFHLLMKTANGLQVPFIDSHCHLDFLYSKIDFKGPISSYLDSTKHLCPPNFLGMVANFCDPMIGNIQGFRKWNELIEAGNGIVKVWQSWSVHPKSVDDANAKTYGFLKDIVNKPNVVSIGEMGMDYSRLSTYSAEAKERQKLALTMQLQIAVESRKPVVIHVRDIDSNTYTVHADTIKIMQEILPNDHRIHVHCFVAGWDEYCMWKKAFPNCYFGLTNMVGFRGSWTKATRDLAMRIPLSDLLLETDAPFMVPNLPPDVPNYSVPGMALCVAQSIAGYIDDE